MNMTDLVQVDKYMIKPSAQLGGLNIIDAQVEDKMQQLAQECYFVEASFQAEASRLVSQLVERCIAYTESARRRAPGTK